MSKDKEFLIKNTYNKIKASDPKRLDYLANIYRSNCGYSEGIVDGLDAIINFIVFNKYSIDEILHGSLS